MDGELVRINLPGYLQERLPSGAIRHRVRPAGDKKTKITLPCGPADPAFMDHYRNARSGIRPNKTKVAPTIRPGTVGFLVEAYMLWLTQSVKSGQASELTLKQRRGMAARLLDATSGMPNTEGRPYRELPIMIPQEEMIRYRDGLMSTPGQAHNTFKFLKAMYAWGVERGHCKSNPAAAIKVVYKNQGGAKPWTVDDLQAFRKAHQPGSMAYLCLTLFMFTACRIGDAYWLGRGQEIRREGQTWLAWQPTKAGSPFVEIPMLPPLQRAIQSQGLVGKAYLMTELGQPFASAEALRNKLRKWCSQAGIEGKSSHGIRKAAGHLLALHGATQYEIMSVHGHAQASTSEVYTAGVERVRLAKQATQKLAGMEW